MSTQLNLDWTASRRARRRPDPVELFIGDAGASIGRDHLSASADYKKVYQEFGITAERVAAAARDSLARVRA